MRVAQARISDLEAILRLRRVAWPDSTAEDFATDYSARAFQPESDVALFLAWTPDGEAIGFANVALHSDYVMGCTTSPVAFLEGIFVGPAHRHGGAGRALVAAAEAWGRARGAAEFASDALLADTDSHAFHRAVGFEETERVVYFRKALTASAP